MRNGEILSFDLLLGDLSINCLDESRCLVVQGLDLSFDLLPLWLGVNSLYLLN
jgi:hypothetical protein